MGSPRHCSKPSCERPAVATLTYAYAHSTAVLGPLATFAEPHSYDLCSVHAGRLTAPRGWDVVRQESDGPVTPGRDEDLEALANAVREPGRGLDQAAAAGRGTPAPPEPALPGRPHLRVVSSD